MTNYLGTLACAALISISAASADTPATSLPHYTQTGGTLEFSFEQAGADSKGAFRKFATTLDYDEKNPAGGKLNVTVQIGSVDTQDKERDGMIVDTDLLNAAKFATATYSGTLAKAGAGLEAVGKLTIRGVSKDVRLPLTIKPAANGLELAGEVKIKRLDFGVGQGDWKATDSVGDVVTVRYKVALAKS